MSGVYMRAMPSAGYRVIEDSLPRKTCVLYMIEEEGKSFAEVARELGVSPTLPSKLLRSARRYRAEGLI